MHKKFRRGFTLVEMMVVMAIIALLSALGLSALFSINNNNTTDRAVEETISVIREAQNKAISVSSDPGGLTIPLAWGFRIDSTTKKVTTFYIKNDNSKTEVSYGTPLDYPTMTSVNVTGDSYHVFTAPFGKYYSSNVDPSGWNVNSQRPYDIIPAGITAAGSTTIVFDYRNSKRDVNINANGDAHAN